MNKNIHTGLVTALATEGKGEGRARGSRRVRTGCRNVGEGSLAVREGSDES